MIKREVNNKQHIILSFKKCCSTILGLHIVPPVTPVAEAAVSLLVTAARLIRRVVNISASVPLLTSGRRPEERTQSTLLPTITAWRRTI